MQSYSNEPPCSPCHRALVPIKTIQVTPFTRRELRKIHATRFIAANWRYFDLSAQTKLALNLEKLFQTNLRFIHSLLPFSVKCQFLRQDVLSCNNSN